MHSSLLRRRYCLLHHRHHVVDTYDRNVMVLNEYRCPGCQKESCTPSMFKLSTRMALLEPALRSRWSRLCEQVKINIRPTAARTNTSLWGLHVMVRRVFDGCA